MEEDDERKINKSRLLWRRLSATPIVSAVFVFVSLCLIVYYSGRYNIFYLLGNHFADESTESTQPMKSVAVIEPAQTNWEASQRQYFKNHVQDIINNIRPPIAPVPSSERKLPYRDLLSIVSDWNPDTPEVPANFQERLQYFDYGNPNERNIAEAYRNAEIPFKLFNISEFEDTAILWSDEYLTNNFKPNKVRFHVEKAKTNHFMFWTGRRSVPNYIPPTEIMSSISYADWLAKANQAEHSKLTNDSIHFYFVSGADAHENGRTFISRDLPLFSTQKNNFFITKVNKNKGIQCRFGMRGVIAEAHYDSGRNMIAMLKGAKRYIISPPRTCEHLGIIADTRHPSYRHSVIDWSDLKQAKQANFDKVDAIDTVLRNGEVLYLPSFWFHYIVSLNYSTQCNSRSGFPDSMIGEDDIRTCLGLKKNKLRNRG